MEKKLKKKKSSCSRVAADFINLLSIKIHKLTNKKITFSICMNADLTIVKSGGG